MSKLPKTERILVINNPDKFFFAASTKDGYDVLCMKSNKYPRYPKDFHYEVREKQKKPSPE